ncbi:GGDEF domain-containing protein [Candidatus Pantoea soli]|uniref:diguanylate cyclase n=1 Tax=Candidatus Pantoea soli TaxID=3098669 RepID=A0A518XFS3_9GAMM|nr:GGDEF domain-containing protein [Pantoea soli]QDY43007.1 GGDEF domain-containing protein [Pantoea soli]
MMSLPELFREESEVLTRSQAVAAQSTLSAGDYRDALLLLSRDYQRLMRETYRMISRSDRAERELNRANEQLQQLAQALEYKASHDPLTAVWNRGAIIQRISQTLQHGAAALIILDIDHFKKINDEHGHPMGDRVICALVARIQAHCPEAASIGRIGGEEFTVLLPHYRLADAVIVAGAIHASLNAAPLAVLPGQLVTASLGVSYGKPGSGFDALYSNADAALYDAKNHGRNRVFFR